MRPGKWPKLLTEEEAEAMLATPTEKHMKEIPVKVSDYKPAPGIAVTTAEEGIVMFEGATSFSPEAGMLWIYKDGKIIALLKEWTWVEKLG